jgi:hypothetical protein
MREREDDWFDVSASWFGVLLVAAVPLLWFAGVLFVARYESPGRQPVPASTLQPLLGSTTPAANSPRPATAAGKAKAPAVLLRLSGLRMGDADTFTADIHLPYGLIWGSRSIRVLGFDAYESSNARRTVEFVPDELLLGKRATDDGWKCLSGADAVYLEATEEFQTTWERILGTVWFDPPGEESGLIEYGAWMRARNHARPSDPVLLKQAKEKTK